MKCCDNSNCHGVRVVMLIVFFHGHADVTIVAVAVIAVVLGVAAYVVAEGVY